jgi:iron complex outermembrane recepter protein
MLRNTALSVLLLASSATVGFTAEPTDNHDSLEEIVVTATPLRSHPLETAQPVTVMSGDNLRRQVSASLGETLSSAPGVTASNYGPVASRPIIRGLGGYRVQMLDDGLASMDASNLSDDHAVSLEPSLARQIEILRGPAALLYGSGGAGGVVNVVSNRLPERRTAETVLGTLELRGDSAQQERSAVAEIIANTGQFSLHADGFARSTQEVDTPNFTVANSASDSWGTGASGTWFGDSGFLGVSLSRFDTEYGLPTEEQAFIAMKQTRVDLKSRLEFTDKFFTALTVRGGLNDYTHTEFEEPGVPGTLFNNRQIESRVTLDRIVPGGPRGTLGVQYGHQNFDAIGEEAFVPASVTKTVGVFALDERDYGQITVQAGGRFDHQRIIPASGSALVDYGADAVSLSLGGLWRFTAQDALALNLTRTQRHPQSTELYADGVHGALQRIEVGADDIHKETGYTIDLALRRVATGVHWNVGVFLNRYRDYIFVTTTGEFDAEEGLPIYRYQQQNARLYGLEVEIASPIAAVTTGQLQARLFGDTLRGKLSHGGGNLPALPAYRLGLGLDYDLHGWHIGAETIHTGAQQRIGGAELPTAGFTLVSLDVSRRLKLAQRDLLVFLRGSNLLNKEARLHASPLKEIVPLAGRSARLGIRLEF